MLQTFPIGFSWKFISWFYLSWSLRVQLTINQYWFTWSDKLLTESMLTQFTDARPQTANALINWHRNQPWNLIAWQTKQNISDHLVRFTLIRLVCLINTIHISYNNQGLFTDTKNWNKIRMCLQAFPKNCQVSCVIPYGLYNRYFSICVPGVRSWSESLAGSFVDISCCV